MERRWVSPPLNSISISARAFIDERQTMAKRICRTADRFDPTGVLNGDVYETPGGVVIVVIAIVVTLGTIEVLFRCSINGES
jgi:hypothetical protein